MSSKRVLATVAGCALAILAGNVYACGESLFRVGKGVSFREYTAPLPGSILVVAKTESELAFVERLAAAGHAIYVVSDPSEIGDQIQKNEINIVLAHFHQRDVVESHDLAATTFIPVARHGTDEVDQADELYQRSLTNEDSVLKFLKTIHKTLKSQS